MALGTGVIGAAAIGTVFLTAAATIANNNCEIEAAQNAVQDEFDDGPDFSCVPVGATLSGIFATGAGVTTAVMSGLTGNRWAKDELDEGYRLEPRRATRYIVGGLGLRVVGLGAIVGALALPYPDTGCLRQRASCRVLVSASLLSAGLAMRWTGLGMFTYGVRHRSSAPRLAVQPYVQPGLRSTTVGLSGRF